MHTFWQVLHTELFCTNTHSRGQKLTDSVMRLILRYVTRPNIAHWTTLDSHCSATFLRRQNYAEIKSNHAHWFNHLWL